MITQVLYNAHQIKTNSVNDFVGIYTGSYILSKQPEANIYSLKTQFLYQQQYSSFVKKHGIERTMVYLYPPFIALLIYPLTKFTFIKAYILFGLINLSLLIVLVSLVYKIIKKNISQEKLKIINPYYFVLLILLFPPIIIIIIRGQFSILLLIILWLGWFFLKKKQYYQAGFSLSLLLIKPHLLIFPTIVFFLKKQWKTITGLCIGCGILFFLSVLLLGTDIWYQYFIFLKQILLINDQNKTVIQHSMTIRGLFQSFYHDNNIIKVLIPLIVLDLIFIYFFIKSWQGKLYFHTDKFNFQYGLLIVTTILLSLHFNYHDISLLLIPIIFLLIYLVNKISLKTIEKNVKKIGSIVYVLIVIGVFIGFGETVNIISTLINIGLFIVLVYFIRHLNSQVSFDFTQDK